MSGKSTQGFNPSNLNQGFDAQVPPMTPLSPLDSPLDFFSPQQSVGDSSLSPSFADSSSTLGPNQPDFLLESLPAPTLPASAAQIHASSDSSSSSSSSESSSSPDVDSSIPGLDLSWRQFDPGDCCVETRSNPAFYPCLGIGDPKKSGFIQRFFLEKPKKCPVRWKRCHCVIEGGRGKHCALILVSNVAVEGLTVGALVDVVITFRDYKYTGRATVGYFDSSGKRMGISRDMTPTGETTWPPPTTVTTNVTRKTLYSGDVSLGGKRIGGFTLKITKFSKNHEKELRHRCPHCEKLFCPRVMSKADMLDHMRDCVIRPPIRTKRKADEPLTLPETDVVSITKRRLASFENGGSAGVLDPALLGSFPWGYGPPRLYPPYYASQFGQGFGCSHLPLGPNFLSPLTPAPTTPFHAPQWQPHFSASAPTTPFPAQSWPWSSQPQFRAGSSGSPVRVSGPAPTHQRPAPPLLSSLPVRGAGGVVGGPVSPPWRLDVLPPQPAAQSRTLSIGVSGPATDIMHGHTCAVDVAQPGGLAHDAAAPELIPQPSQQEVLQQQQPDLLG